MIKEALYYKDNYLMEFDTVVLECINENNKIKVVLKETAFYPEGGGQPSDIGNIDDVEVIHVEEKNGVIYHIVSQPIEVNKNVHCKVDFGNRFANMQNHSGEHIVSGIICSMFNANNIGFHIGKECVNIDFDVNITKEQLRIIENKANEAIYKNIDIKTNIFSREEAESIEFRSKKELNGDIRLVEIPGYDICACCGIHVSKTGEIGIIKLLAIEKYKSGVRISMLTGQKAIDKFTNDYEQIDKISSMFSLKHDEVVNGITEIKEELNNLKKEKSELKNELFDYKIGALESKENMILIEDELNSVEMKNLCEKLEKKAQKIAGVFSKKALSYNFMIISNKVKLDKLFLELKEKFNVKGGGKAEAIQGQFQGEIDEIKQFIENYNI